MSTLPPIRTASRRSLADERNEITIHVCDEAKKTRKDFTCPRDVLLSEMKYFRDYLSTDTHAWDDIDISVHCDIDIFQLLIEYAKGADNQRFEPGNVVSILISSDFLKMDTLTEECIGYCSDNMSEVLATPCNMSCVNDKLVKRLADRFDQRTLEKVVDKRAKFKNKLFFRKLEDLFKESFSNKFSPNNASRLFKCQHCKKLLIQKHCHRIPCTHDRLVIDNYGKVSFEHARDTKWSASKYLLVLKSELKTWRLVYWRVWSLVNYMQCKECDQLFSLQQFQRCLHHPKEPLISESKSGFAQKVYPCCGQTSRLFELVPSRHGCQSRDHVMYFDNNSSLSNDEVIYSTPELYNELLSVKDIVCNYSEPNTEHVSYFYSLAFPSKKVEDTSNSETSTRTVTNKDEANKKEKKRPQSVYKRKSNVSRSKNAAPPQPQQQHNDEDSSTESSQSVMCVVIHKKAVAPAANPAAHQHTWNRENSLRLNQDMQREDDYRRMNELVRQLRPKTAEQQRRHAEDPGVYALLEQKRRQAIQQSSSSAPTTGQQQRKQCSNIKNE